jgi:protein TonB
MRCSSNDLRPSLPNVARRVLFGLLPLVLAGCTSLPSTIVPEQFQTDRGPFVPRDAFPVFPNVERMIGPDDCQGASLAALEASIPEYPRRAWALGRQGWVVVRFHVYSDGQVHRARVARAVPDGPFNGAAVGAVSDWRFRALDGVDILENCVVMFEFRAGEVRIR